ncbi:NDP-sugar synthase [Pseudofrankia sp. BMG5.37]|uniref:nucleotidyltransferase family protein n=1 Tax=Pseudofrankia sp. BMG5.37 TaxID=3050035 RepID=UPI0028944EDB|nr:NDP-sugar synthase [Pseudofrankia sp. BMG5.37]MDT3439040.1 NDP-sugar synthase [Pseudofrankia sp. BMG5.37]
MDAVMLVGGKGTRLRPLTMSAPKPMLPVAGVPVTAHMLARARDAGIDRVVLATSYKAEVFEEYFGDGSALGLELAYVTETEPLGTGGAIRNVAGFLRCGPDDPVVIFNGDILSGLDIQALIARHTDSGAAVTLHLTEVEDPRAFGVVPTDEHGRVKEFLEKTLEPPTNLINAGCYVFRRSVIDDIPAGRPVSVERETFPGLLAAGVPIVAYPDSTYWLDLGTPAAFVRGSRDLVQGRIASSALPGPVGEALVLDGATVAADAKLCGGATIGAGAAVGGGATVDGAVLFDGAAVGCGAVVRDSVVGRDAVICDGVVLDDVVVGDGARIEPGNELRAGVRVFPGSILPSGCVRFSSDQS